MITKQTIDPNNAALVCAAQTDQVVVSAPVSSRKRKGRGPAAATHTDAGAEREAPTGVGQKAANGTTRSGKVGRAKATASGSNATPADNISSDARATVAAASETSGRRKTVPSGVKTDAASKGRKTNAATEAGKGLGATSAGSKTELVLKKLRTAKGASIDQLVEATGWQAHSVRGFLSAVVRKKMSLNLTSETGKDGVRRYRIADGPVS